MADPLPEVVEAFLDAHPDRPINPFAKVDEYIELSAKTIEDQREAWAWFVAQGNVCTAWREMAGGQWDGDRFRNLPPAWHLVFLFTGQPTYVGPANEWDLNTVMVACYLARRDA